MGFLFVGVKEKNNTRNSFFLRDIKDYIFILISNVI